MKNIYYWAIARGATAATLKCYVDLVHIYTSRLKCVSDAIGASLHTDGAVYMCTAEDLGLRDRINTQERYFYKGEEVTYYELRDIIGE